MARSIKDCTRSRSATISYNGGPRRRTKKRSSSVMLGASWISRVPFRSTRVRVCQITTVMRLKVHVVDGVRVAPTPKEKKKKGRKLGGEDDEDDVKPYVC